MSAFYFSAFSPTRPLSTLSVHASASSHAPTSFQLLAARTPAAVQTGRPHLPPTSLQTSLLSDFSFSADLLVFSLGSPALTGSKRRNRKRAFASGAVLGQGESERVWGDGKRRARGGLGSVVGSLCLCVYKGKAAPPGDRRPM